MGGLCPSCNRPMKALFMSMFCPNDCDRRPKAEATWTDIIAADGQRTGWQLSIVKAQMPFPDDAVRFTYIAGYEPLAVLMEDARALAANGHYPGLRITERDRLDRCSRDHVAARALVAFRLIDVP